MLSESLHLDNPEYEIIVLNYKIASMVVGVKCNLQLDNPEYLI